MKFLQANMTIMLSAAEHLYRLIRTVQRSDRDASIPLRCAQHDRYIGL